MAQRSELQTLLEELLGSTNVYFQKPSNLTMSYPAIIYKRSSATTTFADNAPYSHTKRYEITYIDKNPDSEVPDKIAQLPRCLFDRHFTADNLNHDVYNIYF